VSAILELSSSRLGHVVHRKGAHEGWWATELVCSLRSKVKGLASAGNRTQAHGLVATPGQISLL
jgi:hypothetical protein